MVLFSQEKLLILCAVILGFVQSCAHKSKNALGTVQLQPSLPYEPVELVETPLQFCKKWEKNLAANLSYIQVSKDGSKYLVSSSANRGRPKGIEARIQLISRTGAPLWAQWMRQPIRGQSLSQKGDLVSASNYEDKVFLYNSRGGKIWEKPHLGMPLVLEASKNIVIFNDDDSDPEIAFTTYDYAGKQVAQAKVAKGREPVDLAYFTNEADGKTYLAIALSGRNQDDDKWMVMAQNQELYSKGTLKGEPVSVALYEATKLFILYSDPIDPSEQRLAAIALPSGKKIWDVELDRHFEVLKVVKGEKEANSFLLLYGNSTRGQAISAFELENGDLIWKHSYNSASTYSSPVQVFEDNAALRSFAAILVDKTNAENAPPAGTLFLIGINREGKTSFEIPINAPDGIYSYSMNIAQKPEVLFGVGEPGNSSIVQFEQCSK